MSKRDKNKLGRNRNWLFSRFATHLTPVLSLMIVVGIGIYGSVRADELSTAWPFACWSGEVCSQWSWEAFLFYLTVGVLSIVVAVQAHTSADRHRQTEELLRDTQAMIKVAPPRRLLEYVKRQYDIIQGTLTHLTSRGAIEDQDFDYNVRLILRAIIDVAHFWDTHREERDGGDGLIYGGNIMLVYPASMFDEQHNRNRLRQYVRFVRRSVIAEDSWREFDFYIRSVEEFSTSNGVPEGEMDAGNGTLILGVNARTKKRRMPHGTIMGAPWALFYGKPQYIQNTATIVTQCRQDSYFGTLCEEVEEYYRGDTRAKSILSIPLPCHLERGTGIAVENTRHTAVLNLFRNKPHLLGNGETCEDFTRLMTPFLYLIDQCLEAYLSDGE